MTEQEALNLMVAPGTRRPGKYREGVIQIHVTRACDKSCFACTQGSNLGGKTKFMSVEHFAQAVESLRGYFGVVGVFGGNPAMSPHFVEYCQVLRESWVPSNQRGLWCNNPLTIDKAVAARLTFDPAVSNLNVHMDRRAYDLFKTYWPECSPCGLTSDSRHSPPFVAMKDMGIDDGQMWELISDCDINQHWSAMIGVFRDQLRAWFCEIAGAQSMLHQDEPDYPDTGFPVAGETFPGRGDSVVAVGWYGVPMAAFRDQVRKHCFDCGVPLRGRGENAMIADQIGVEQVSETHAGVYKPKRKDRKVQVVTELVQLGSRLDNVTQYIQNSQR